MVKRRKMTRFFRIRKPSMAPVNPVSQEKDDGKIQKRWAFNKNDLPNDYNQTQRITTCETSVVPHIILGDFGLVSKRKYRKRIIRERKKWWKLT